MPDNDFKIAFFVEGQTERIFLEKFLEHYSTIIHSKKYQKTNYGKSITCVNLVCELNKSAYNITIFDTTGGVDNQIFSFIDKRKELIAQKNFQYVIILTDLYPEKNLTELLNLRIEYINNKLPILKGKTEFCFAVREIEAWFLADYEFFKKKNDVLTTEYIKEQLKIDLENDNLEEIPHPAEIINQIYKLIGEKYKKKEEQSYEIVKHFDFDFLYCDSCRKKVKSWNYFCEVIEKKIK